MQATDALVQGDVCLTTLSSGQRVGLSLISVASFISFCAVLGFLAMVTWNLIHTIRSSPNFSRSPINTDIDGYFLSLLFADILQALGGMMNVKWIQDGQTVCGNYCTAQGALQQVGTPSIALSTLAVAVHTFFVIFFRWTPPRNHVLGISVLTVIWLFLILIVLLGWVTHHSNNINFYTPTPYWCWINAKYLNLRIAGEYFWVWFTALMSLILYILLFLKLRGNIFVNPDRWLSIKLRWSPHSFQDDEPFDSHRTVAASIAQREAQKMLWYPLCYFVVVIPMSVVRWLMFWDPSHTPPIAATVFAAAMFKLSGAINVALFSLTRPKLLSFRRHPARPRSIGAAHSLTLPSDPYAPYARARGGAGSVYGSDAEDGASSPLPNSAAAMLFHADLHSADTAVPAHLRTRIPSPHLHITLPGWEPEGAEGWEPDDGRGAQAVRAIARQPSQVPLIVVGAPGITLTRSSSWGAPRRETRYLPVPLPPGLPLPVVAEDGDFAVATATAAQRPGPAGVAPAAVVLLQNSRVNADAEDAVVAVPPGGARPHGVAITPARRPVGSASAPRRLTWAPQDAAPLSPVTMQRKSARRRSVGHSPTLDNVPYEIGF